MHPLQKFEFAEDKANGVPLFKIVLHKRDNSLSL